MSWYALHCRSNTEKLVAEKLAYAGIETYYPHLVVKSKDKKREIEKKFFPGYSFARFDLDLDKIAVISVPQVVGILGWGHHAVAIPDHEIAAVRLMVDTVPLPGAPIPVAVPYVAEGDRVLVRRGPLAGLEGFVAYSKSGGARVIVSVAMLARSISAEVDGAWLELIERAVPKAA